MVELIEISFIIFFYLLIINFFFLQKMIQVVLLRSVLLFNVVLVCWSLVIEEEFRLFSLHPVFAVIFQVLFYEGIVALQVHFFIIIFIIIFESIS